MLSGVNQGEKHPHIPARNILDRIVLGGSDGAIEGLAMSSALNGAGLGFSTIRVAGLAFALAGAISMFFSTYLSRKSELESIRIDTTRERMEIEIEPEEEKREMEELLKKDGYKDDEIKVIMMRLAKDKNLWLKEMLRRELRVDVEEVQTNLFARPTAAGVAFFLLAILAISPYTFSILRIDALFASVSLSLVALFALGSWVFIPRNFRPMAGLESALVGGLAGALLFLVGLLVSTI